MQSQRQLLLLRGMRYFETTARRGSVTLAAAELGVSASAVSRQISDLSRDLGEKLIVRTGHGIALTSAGEHLLARIGPALNDISSTIAELLGQTTSVFSIATCSSFGPGWLSPRLPQFIQAHPEIELEVRLYGSEPEQTFMTADAIVTANPLQPGYRAVTLFDERLVAVARPDGREPSGRSLRLITTDPAPPQFGADWAMFLNAGGNHGLSADAGWLRCTHYLLAMSMARAGAGVALVPDFLAAQDIRSGALEQVSPAVMPSGRTYKFCFKEPREADTSVRTVARWLRAAARETIVRPDA